MFQTDYHLDGFKREEFDDFSDLEEDLLRDFECFSDDEFEFNAQNDATNLVQNKLYNTSATLEKSLLPSKAIAPSNYSRGALSKASS